MDKHYNIILSFVIVFLVLFGGFFFTEKLLREKESFAHSRRLSTANGKQMSNETVIIPLNWGDLGVKMVEAGVIDFDKFKSIYADRGGIGRRELKMLSERNNGAIMMNKENSGMILNMLWALGLANKSSILLQGPMADKRYGGAENFASTGGWTLSKGSAMDHYARHSFIVLTKEEEELMEQITKNIYRPCCDNPTYFPDCNHGMAMLGLIQFLVSNGINESEIYKIALGVNSLWFPGQYEAIGFFFSEQGIDWRSVDPKIILGKEYSSASGFKKIMSLVKTKPGGGSGCGV